MAYVNGSRNTTLSLAARFDEIRNQAAQAYAQWSVYRRTLNELRSLNDRELADLGLNRSALRNVALEAAYGKDALR